MTIFFRLALFLLLILITDNWAHADYLKQVAKDFKPLSGYIVMVEKGEIIIDHGAKSGVRIGDLFAVVVPGKKIINPVTGKVLGTLERARAVLKVTRLKPDFSYVRAVKGKETIDIGDIIRRFESMTALFWDYSGQGEYMYAGLQNLLPGLNWIAYDEAQRSKPEGHFLKNQSDADIIFINTSESLEVRDSKFMLVRQYGPPIKRTLAPKKRSTSPLPPSKPAKKYEKPPPEAPKTSVKAKKSASKPEPSVTVPTEAPESRFSEPVVEEPEVFVEPVQVHEPVTQVTPETPPAEVEKPSVTLESFEAMPAEEAEEAFENQFSEPVSEEPKVFVEPVQVHEPISQTLPAPPVEVEKPDIAPEPTETVLEEAPESDPSESVVEKPEAYMKMKPAKPYALVPETTLESPAPTAEVEKPVIAPEPAETVPVEALEIQPSEPVVEEPETSVEPSQPHEPVAQEIPAPPAEVEKPVIAPEPAETVPVETPESQPNPVVEEPEASVEPSQSHEPATRESPAPPARVTITTLSPESSETVSAEASESQPSEPVVEKSKAFVATAQSFEPVTLSTPEPPKEVERPVAALQPSVSVPGEASESQLDEHTSEGFQQHLKPPFKQGAATVEIEGTLVTIADFIYFSNHTMMVATDGLQIDIHELADNHHTKLFSADMPFSTQILSVQWWQPESMGPLYVVAVSWYDYAVSSEILKYTKNGLEPWFAKSPGIFGVFDTDNDSRPESLFVQEFVREKFFGDTVQAVKVNGNELVYEDTAIEFPEGYTILGSRLVDLTGDSQLETVYVRKGNMYVYRGKEMIYRSGRRMGGSQSMLTYVPDSQNPEAGTKTVVFEVPPLVADFDHDGLPEIWSVFTEKSIVGYDSSGYRVRKSWLTEIKYLNSQFVENVFGESFKGPIQGLGYFDRTGYVMYWNRIHFLSEVKKSASMDSLLTGGQFS